MTKGAVSAEEELFPSKVFVKGCEKRLSVFNWA
jgi:hypothetical protein